MSPIVSRPWQIALVLLLLPSVAVAVNPAHWSIVEQITRSESSKIWNSPTPVDLGKMVWQYDFEITKLTGTVNVPLIGDITQDITSSIPSDSRMGSGETRSLPAVLWDDMFAEPTTGSSANVHIEIDNLGFGRAAFSNIVLGSVNVPLFGSRPIQRINIEASVDIIGYNFGDYNRNGVVDAADYVVWRDTLGSTTDLRADGNNSGEVTQLDYDVWRAHFGQTSGSGTGASANADVPEPGTLFLLLVGITALFGRRRASVP